MLRLIRICQFFAICAIAGMSLASAFAAEKPETFVQLGHSRGVTSVAFSPDGRYVLSGDTRGTIKLWDVLSEREIMTFRGHSGNVTCLDFSNDSQYVVSGSSDKSVKLWDIATGRVVKSFMGHADEIRLVALSLDGRYVSSVSEDSTLKLWNISTGREIKTIDKIYGKPRFFSDSKYVSSSEYDYTGGGGYSQTLKIYNITTGEETKAFIIIKDVKFLHGVNPISFSHDGKYMVSQNWKDSEEIEIWDIFTVKKIMSHRLINKPIVTTSFSPDGKHIAIAGFRKKIELWDISTGEIKTLNYKATAAIFSPDGKYLLTGYGMTLNLIDISNGRVIKTFAKAPTTIIGASAISPNGRYALAGNKDVLKLWDISAGREIRTLKDTASVISISSLRLRGDDTPTIAFSPDGKYALSGSRDNTSLKLWDIPTGREIRQFTGHKAWVLSAAFSPDGQYALSGSFDETLKLWEVSTGREIRTFTGHTRRVEGFTPVNSVAFSPDGQYALSGSADETLKLWEVSTGREIRTFTGHKGWVLSVAFSPDGRYALSGSDDETLKLWEVSTGREIRTFTGHKGWVLSVAFSPDGRYILSGGEDTVMVLWDIATGRQTKIFYGHGGYVNSVAFSPDGIHVLSSSSDSTTRLWDTSTGKEIAQFITFTDGEWIVITPEGYFNASPNGAKHLNVRLGNKVFSIDNFYEKFFNPVYVASVLQGKKIEAVADIRKGFAMPPDVKIISPEPNTTFNADIITITVSAKDTGGGIDEIRLYHNGKAIGEDQRAVKIAPSKQGGNEVTKTYTVTLVDGLNNFRAVGFSRDRTESNPYELIVKLTAPSKDVSMYILAVGINKYKNPALNLNYAVPDARGIVDFFKQKGKGLFKNVTLIDIYNEQATKQGITSKLKQLQNTQPQDAVLIYLAGHGESLGDTWYFIPHEVTYPEREEEVKTKGISSEELSGYIKDIKAQKILILIDACKSGAVMIAFRGFEDRKALSQLSRSTGVHIIAASTKDQFAAEVKELGHGVFTYTLLEGLKGKASGRGETVTVRKLMGYVEEHLPDITKKYKQEAQYPVVDSRGMDFPLVIVK